MDCKYAHTTTMGVVCVSFCSLTVDLSLSRVYHVLLLILGRLWKHVEYRNRHNESRRNRELIISSIATVVNYEYCFYWKFKLDGTIEYEIRLTGELSTNLLSAGEDTPTHGTLVAPGVNSQIHQHMFCAKLDMAGTIQLGS